MSRFKYSRDVISLLKNVKEFHNRSENKFREKLPCRLIMVQYSRRLLLLDMILKSYRPNLLCTIFLRTLIIFHLRLAGNMNPLYEFILYGRVHTFFRSELNKNYFYNNIYTCIVIAYLLNNSCQSFNPVSINRCRESVRVCELVYFN